MMILSEDQPNNLNREALIIIVASLQDQLASVQSQLDTANTQLADTNHQIELLTEQIRIMNQRHYGRQAESNLTEGQLTLFDSFNEAEMTADENASEPEITEVIIASYRRKKTIGKRDEDLDGLPARIIEHSRCITNSVKSALICLLAAVGFTHAYLLLISSNQSKVRQTVPLPIKLIH